MAELNAIAKVPQPDSRNPRPEVTIRGVHQAVALTA
jgi:hypothetical protein